MKTVMKLLAAVLVLGWGGAVHASLHHEILTYQDGKTTLEGYLVYDDSIKGARPGVIVVHEWMGLNDYAKRRADMLASEGYVALAADIYGQGVRPTTPDEAGKTAGLYKNDRELTRSRAQAALKALKKNPLVDGKHIGAIGYCFGGMTVLELARSGADLQGIVSFHGSLDAPKPAEPGKVKAKVLVLHGADDPHVPAADVAAFQDEMRRARADWNLVVYGGAKHGFTNPDNDKLKMNGVGYNAQADRRSWKAMEDFFAEVLKR